MTAPAPRKGPVAGELNPTDLMRACGSKNGRWKPESPDQWRWQMKRGEGIERVLAWVKLNSVARGSPFCVNASGDALTTKEAAKDLGLAIQTVKNCCTILAGQGRIRMQKGYRIWYRADVAEPIAPRMPREAAQCDEDPEESETEGRNKGEYADDTEYRVHGIFPEYLNDFIKKLPPRKLAILDAYSSWRKKFFADGMAGLRAIDEQVQDTTLLSLGCNKKRLPKRRPADSKCVQLSLLDAPPFIDATKYPVHGRPVQSTEIPAYKPESRLVLGTEGAPILIAVEPFSEPSNKSVCLSGEGPTDRHAETVEYGAKTAALKTLLLNEYGRKFPADPPSSRLCAQIFAALEGAPIELLRERMRQRIDTATGMGFALSLANDVGQSWAGGAAARDVAQRTREVREVHEREETVRVARATLADPKASHQERELAEEMLAGAAGGGV